MTAPDIVISEFMDDAAVAGLAADFAVAGMGRGAQERGTTRAASSA